MDDIDKHVLETLARAGEEQRELARGVTLNQISSLAAELVELRAEQARLEEEAAEIKVAADKIAEEQLPELLAIAGLKDFTLASGARLSMQTVLSASIREERRAEAHAWLRANGLGDLIKNEVTVTFGRGEDADAHKLLGLVESMAHDNVLHFGGCTQREHVHPQTLAAQVRELKAQGKPYPAELLGVLEIRRAVVGKERS